jgi:hypothetical protein
VGNKRVFAPLLCVPFAVSVGLRAIGPVGQTGASRFALVQVTDPRGKAFVDIGVDDFVVEEAGAERELLDVRVADYPLAIVVDNGAAARDDFAMLRSAVARFLTRLGPRPVTLITTAEAPTAIATFEDERTTVASKLDALEVVDAPSQLLHASAMAGATIKGTGTLFSTIVVATASPTEARDADDAEPLAPIIDSRAVVHVVANIGRIGAADQLLRGLAAQTHGDYVPIYVPASYQPAFDRLATRLTTEMLIEYLVPAGSKAADVKIGVRIPGARVRGLGVAPR